MDSIIGLFRKERMFNIHIIHHDKDFLIIDKPSGLPSAPLSENDTKNAFSIIAKDFPNVKNVLGKKSIEGGLVHRIDTDTRGLLLIAQTQNFYDSIFLQQSEGNFIKYYTAYCLDKREGLSNFKKPPLSITSRFRFLGEGRKKVEPVFEHSGRAALKKAGSKLYTTNVVSIEDVSMPLEKNCVKVQCSITEGFRHQVRSHLAYLGFSIISDPLYGTQGSVGDMQFFASGLEFTHPETGELLQYFLSAD